MAYMLLTICLGMACALPAQQDPDRAAEAWAHDCCAV